MPHPAFASLHQALLQAANFSKALPMERYMKNKFSFLGVPATERREIFKQWKLEHKPLHKTDWLELIENCWQQEEREFQYCALDMLSQLRRKWNEADIEWLERLIVTKSWWDTVDALSVHGLGAWIQHFPQKQEEVCKAFFESRNIWLQRSVLIHQLQFKQQTNTELLFYYIEQLADHRDFFIRKAIGWALRQLSQSRPELVIEFVKTHPLSPLSEREALRKLKRPFLS